MFLKNNVVSICFQFLYYWLSSCLLMQEAQAFAEENGLFFMETSAKTAINVNDIFYEIGTGLRNKILDICSM